MGNTTRKAVAVFPGHGYVTFQQKNIDPTIVHVKLENMPVNSRHAIHIHEFGDLRSGDCQSAGLHWNPWGRDHGDLEDIDRHAGDLGNIEIDKSGKCDVVLSNSLLHLRGHLSILGRSLVIHAKEDDLGRGGTQESRISGSSGERKWCAIIGHMNPTYKDV